MPHTGEDDDKSNVVKRTDPIEKIAKHIENKKDKKRKLKALHASPSVSQHFLVTVTSLCVTRRFWKALRRLLKTRLLSLPAVPTLLADLRQQNRVVRTAHYICECVCYGCVLRHYASLEGAVATVGRHGCCLAVLTLFAELRQQNRALCTRSLILCCVCW